MSSLLSVQSSIFARSRFPSPSSKYPCVPCVREGRCKSLYLFTRATGVGPHAQIRIFKRGIYPNSNKTEVFIMNLTKEFFEKQLKKHETVTIFSPENISLDISKVPYIRRDDTDTEFDMDCTDLADYCNALGLSTKPNNI
nr:MAG TPA: hypothetical protein [Caudoviricetes sp.]